MCFLHIPLSACFLKASPSTDNRSKGENMNLRQQRLSRFLFGFVCVVLLLASAILAQDPVNVAGDSYKLISENARVRILDVKLAPGQKTVMHSHPDVLAVILAPSTIKQTTADGKIAEVGGTAKRGAVLFEAAITHTSENIGKTPFHAILVEFKQPAPAAGAGGEPSMPAPFKQVLDNDYARIFDGTSLPGGSLAEHTHADHITIALSNGSMEITDKDGKKQTYPFKRDETLFSGPTTHSAVNTSKTALRLIDVELK
jgi:quercetin dioxygenase-like cupin family protein